MRQPLFALAFVLLAAGIPAAAQQNAELHVLPVQGNVYMLVGAGGNIAIQVGNQGVLLVDTGLAQNSEKVLAEVRKLSSRPIRYIINTHFHADHTGGNEAIAKAGVTITGGNVAGNLTDAAEGAAIVANQAVLDRMSAPPAAGEAAIPFGALPTDTYITNEKHMYFNGEGIEIIHQPNAHTDGDSFVYFRRSDVVSAGDIFTPGNYPIIDLQHGGSIQGTIAALNKLIELTIPADKQEGGTYVIPGHGRLCDQADVVEYRDMATIIRDRIQNLIHKGMTLEQVKAAQPTRDYDPEYGATTGFWTTDKFVEAVYRSLSERK
ncbi:MAG TPA: MBL fold metallo-hydrolase [Bryobacteraceae bacterium]|nr:MBL fold metallo-hydrolase [Bryobacteraceae bacterium]